VADILVENAPVPLPQGESLLLRIDCHKLHYDFYAGTGEKQALDVVKLMLEEIDKLKKGGITKEEFVRSKEQLKGSYMLGQESTSARANAIGKSELLRGAVYTDEEIMARIEKITQDDVMAIIPEILDLDNMAASFVGRVNAQEKQIEQMIL
jgi:predicted Zn-dependent peptidase